MERIDPMEEDVAWNWHTNSGVLAYGQDASGNDLLASPGGRNEWPIDWYALPPMVTAYSELPQAGTFELPLPQISALDLPAGWGAADETGETLWPRLIVSSGTEARLVEPASGGGGVESIYLRLDDGMAHLVIESETLDVDEYRVWLVVKPGYTILVPFSVTVQP